jgi:hypothetical protein
MKGDPTSVSHELGIGFEIALDTNMGVISIDEEQIEASPA